MMDWTRLKARMRESFVPSCLCIWLLDQLAQSSDTKDGTMMDLKIVATPFCSPHNLSSRLAPPTPWQRYLDAQHPRA
jgi:hypothetical protein